jgi:uncharacterized membrane protein
MNIDSGESMLRLSRRVAKVLRIGAMLSIALLVIGVIALLFRASANVGATLLLTELPSAIAKGEPSALLTLGILAMMITPIARVFILVEGFLAHKDRAFALIGSVVLMILLLSIALAY